MLKTGRVAGIAAAGLVGVAFALAWSVVTGQAHAACAAPTLVPTVAMAPEGSHLRVTGTHWGPCDDTLPAPDAEPPFTRIDVVLVGDDGPFLLGQVPVSQRRVDVVVDLPHGLPPGMYEVQGRHEDPALESLPEPVHLTSGVRTSTRVAGDDRVATSVAVSQRNYPDGAAAVYLARSDVPFDAMVGATATDGPILLVRGCDLPGNVSEEIDRLGPAEVVGLGGSAAVCDDVLETASGIVPIPSSADGLTLFTATLDGRLEVRVANHRDGAVGVGRHHVLERLSPSGFEPLDPPVGPFPDDLQVVPPDGFGMVASFDDTIVQDGDERPVEPGRYRLVIEVEGTTLAVSFDLPPEP